MHFHFPVLPSELPLSLSARQLLGLPEYFTALRMDSVQAAARVVLNSPRTSEWLEVLSSDHQPIEARWTSGLLLAITGDPRIVTRHPHLIDVEGGEFEVGLELGEIESVLQRYAGLGLHESWIRKECPRHPVKLKSFRIGKYLVTNSEYREFIVATHGAFPTSWKLGRYPIERSNHPVHGISETQAEEYIKWLSEQTGRHFRLPSEAEWEVAASGGRGLEFPWGDSFLPDCCNTAEAGILDTTPVGMFPRGEALCGASDLGGNVEEYVSDAYSPYSGGDYVSDHLAELKGQYRVTRGGSFARFRDLARCKRRHGIHGTTEVYVAGFRLAESAPDA